MDINWKLAAEFVDGDMELLRAVLGAALEECPDHFERLQEAIEQELAEQARYAAHAIKGSLRLLQYRPLDEQLYELESMGANQSMQDAPEVFRRCVSMWSEIRIELERFVQGGAATA